MQRLMLVVIALLFSFQAEAKTYKILVEDNWPPFAFREKGKPRGLSVDIVLEAYAKAGVKIELIQVPFLRCIALTESGKESGCFNSAKNEELTSKFLFPKEHLFRSRGLIVSKKLNVMKPLTKVKDLEGKSVALPAEFPFGQEFDDNKKILKHAVASDSISLKMVAAERVLYAAIDEMVLAFYLNNDKSLKGKIVPVLELTNEPIYVHFSKTHKDTPVLMEKLDQGLAELKKSGDYDKILQKWLGKDVALEKFK
ncbi:substrate-binding periplasmic protein [Bdellovibrio reynosensis]|uniref:Transporter substrate-binding domain-containing protein n=1 Tax=Bdellovibrio reynosensis TaxID=2835041 RepID=A0ABY4C612_9BACT|nr:transporter substrate-binding domain-containing protein [Bdellovibrio reynosensis]UOF00387.1 transporter substrate-binding domain-containing protein [Bdellovibrio reynosensis]